MKYETLKCIVAQAACFSVRLWCGFRVSSFGIFMAPTWRSTGLARDVVQN